MKITGRACLMTATSRKLQAEFGGRVSPCTLKSRGERMSEWISGYLYWWSIEEVSKMELCYQCYYHTVVIKPNLILSLSIYNRQTLLCLSWIQYHSKCSSYPLCLPLQFHHFCLLHAMCLSFIRSQTSDLVNLHY